MKYRKKPVVIEAVQWTGSNTDEIDEFVPKDDRTWYSSSGKAPPKLFINTLEGNHFANVGDFIIKGVKGEFYPCKPDIFAMTYEPADEASQSEVDQNRPRFKATMVFDHETRVVEGFLDGASQSEVEPVYYQLRNRFGFVDWRSPSKFPFNEQEIERFNKGFPEEAPFSNGELFAAQPTEAKSEVEPVGKRLTRQELMQGDGRVQYVWWKDVPHGAYLYLAPPTAALIRELAIRECAGVCDMIHEENCQCITETGCPPCDCYSDNFKQAILTLIPQPSSLEEFGLKCFKRGQVANGAVHSVGLDIVNEVLKGGV